MYQGAGWCSRDVIHIRWDSTRKSATLRTKVLALLIIVWWSSTSFRSHLNQNFCLANPKLPRLLAAAGPWCSRVRRAWLHRAWTWLALQRVFVKVWHSLSVEDLVEIPPSGHVCPGSRPMAVWNYGKGTTTPWRKRLRRHVVVGHRQDGDV